MAFNTKVQHRDVKTGKVTKLTPYRMRVSREHGVTFIRDNKEYHPDGSLKRELKVMATKVEEPKVETPVELTPEEKELGVTNSKELLKNATKNEIRRSK